MARIFIEGFETGTFDLWPSRNGIVGPLSIQGSPGAYYIGNFFGNQCNISCPLPSRSFIYVAFKVNPFYYGGAAYCRDMMFLYGPGGWIMNLSRNLTTGFLELWTGYRTSLKVTGTIAIPINTWTLVEFYYLPHASAGVFQTKVDGVSDINFSGITSPRTENINGMMLGTWNTPTTWYGYYNDIICDDADWIGNTKVVLLSMGADEPDPQWTPSTGSTQYGVIDETPKDDADYLKTNLVDQVSMVKVSGIQGMVNDIKCIQPHIRISKQGDVIPTKVDLGISIDGDGSSPRFGPSLKAPTTPWGYSYLDVEARDNYILDTNPATGLPWTRSEVDALKFVIKSIA